MDLVLDILLDAVLDTLLLVPFLFVTYVVMEWLEHKTSDDLLKAVGKAGVSGPIVGGLLGLVPQCGFSAATATLYSARMVSVGTLVAVFLSTSDEMLPIFIAEGIPVGTMLGMLGLKLIVAIVAGLLVDVVARRLRIAQHEPNIHKLCEEAQCYCNERCEGCEVGKGASKQHAGEDEPREDALDELDAHKAEIEEATHAHHDHDHEHHHEHGSGSIIMSAVKHTLQVTLFVFIVSLVLTAVFEIVGDETIASVLGANRWASIVLCALVGLIPNCAASVAVVTLYVEGVITTGACMAGLLPAAGVGILVLLRTNRGGAKENVAILSLLVLIGIVSGFVIDAIGITF